MSVQANGRHMVVSIVFAVIGLFLLVTGGALFITRLPISGYGIWIFVWGLAWLVGASSRYMDAKG